jgi:hypothetical protein
MGEPLEEDDELDSHHLCFLIRPLGANRTVVVDKAEGNASTGVEEEVESVAGEVAASLGDDTGVGLEGREVSGAEDGW